jgi:hypothetical protein
MPINHLQAYLSIILRFRKRGMDFRYVTHVIGTTASICLNSGSPVINRA